MKPSAGNPAAYCWLIPLRQYKHRWRVAETIKDFLIRDPRVLRIIDHGTHLKVTMARDAKPPALTPGSRRVRDRTMHQLDGMLWGFITAAYRHCVKQGHDPELAAAVLVHYTWNLFLEGGVAANGTEDVWLAGLALTRAKIMARVSDRQAHGWELAALKGKRKRKGGR